MVKIKRAVISVSDKTGLEELVKALNKFGVEIISTGGTAKSIRSLNIPVKDMSDYTGFPEMLDGRVKTLHPKIHGGLLALREDSKHMDTAKEHGIGLIDMVVVNLYPFEKTVSKTGVELSEAVENIDIGGPSMLRSAAKNYRSVCVVCDTADYGRVIEELERGKGGLPEELLAELGIKVFGKTSKYDAAIYEYLKVHGARSETSVGSSGFPDKLTLSFTKAQDLRYGENPHQKAAFYKDDAVGVFGVAGAAQLHGKELSFNNIIDINAALEMVKDFDEPAAAIIKHTNPCGAAVAGNIRDAYIDALDCDRLSAFGSIVGFNRGVDIELAKTILEEADFVECIIAPSYDGAALEALRVKKNLRLLELKDLYSKKAPGFYDLKKVSGGLLVQDQDKVSVKETDLNIVTKLKPTKEDISAMLFGWKVVKHVKSNAIVLCHGTKTVGVGAGQMSRVDSVMIATRKAGNRSKGSVLASDAFFPKEDGIEQAASSGVRAIIQPGGSVRDAEVIKAADKFGIAMVFTGIRHFKH
ncbi:MAG: bifunctional phosphoribosylaminoimidazolecarboxamide formyltransferase/IMP cyclohydrolase [Candidatus Omnitrophica bacterium]|nr:bifunctional phosphoribosylaminoimidazolecarboxamide formyltransferase/IMP cyclohydrolase [Candidatus Omnitrophota bacterium]